MVGRLCGPSALGGLSSCSDCDLCRGGDYGFSHSSAICHADSSANSDLYSYPDPDCNTDTDCNGNANIYTEPHTDAYNYSVQDSDKYVDADTCEDAEASSRRSQVCGRWKRDHSQGCSCQSSRL